MRIPDKKSSLRSFHILALASAFLFFTGCEMIPLASLPGPQIPTYPQSQPVKVMEPIAVHIVKCYWSDEYEKPGLKNIPERYREERRQYFVSKPKAKFLVLEIEAVNTGTRAAAWSRIQPPVFQLENNVGAIYAPESDQVTQGSFASTIITQGATINPGMTFPGIVVFDVPPGDYNLGFALASQYSAGSFSADRISFKWQLSPTLN